MPNTLPEYLASATNDAYEDIVEAFWNVPGDKWLWSPGGNVRPAMHVMADCALLIGYDADALYTRMVGDIVKSPDGSAWDDFQQEIAISVAQDEPKRYRAERALAAAQGWDDLSQILSENVHRAIAGIAATPEGTLGEEIELPRRGGKIVIASAIALPHQLLTGRVGYIDCIASLARIKE